MTIASQHEWLRRLSDYHSGDVSAAEAAAVEEHLAGCEECREALALYQRFYALARSPLRLGEPSPAAEFSMSTGDPSSRDQDEVVSNHHLQPLGRPRPARSRVLLGIASVLAASIVIAGFLAVLGPRIHVTGPQTTSTPLPSATPAGPTPTVQTTNLPEPGTGYTNAGPDWASTLAFAPSSTSIIYACGESPFGSGPLLIAASTDGGHTWQPRASPGQLSICNLTVDPSNPLDLALIAEYCSGDQFTPKCEPHSHLYRSDDSGNTWSEVGAPGGDWILPNAPFSTSSQFAWIGSTLFIGTTLGIARSVADGPFTLLRQPFFGTTPDVAIARTVLTIGGTLIVTRDICSPTCSGQIAERSNDLGVHWTPMSTIYRSSPVYLVANGADGKTLFGMQYTSFPNSRFLSSVDGGSTWTPLPPIPASVDGFTGSFETPGAFSSTPIVEAPDGTIYTEFNFPGPSSGIGSPSSGIYELAPGAENWRYFAPEPGGDPQIFLWSSSGHLAAIWAGRGSPSLSGFQYRLF